MLAQLSFEPVSARCVESIPAVPLNFRSRSKPRWSNGGGEGGKGGGEMRELDATNLMNELLKVPLEGFK